MPSITEFFGYAVTNFGPLTTTYTAPSSCATDTSHLNYANASQIAMEFGRPTCDVKPIGECLPSGSAYDAMISEFWESPHQGFFPYYSPGLVCPSGWSTVGVWARTASDGEEASGVFTDEAWGDAVPTEVREQYLEPTEFWMNILEPSETVAFCCPSGYVANARGNCYSSVGPVESPKDSSICAVYYPHSAVVTVTSFEGTRVTPGLISVASVTDEYTTITDALTYFADPTEVSEEWALVNIVPAVALVSKEEDVEEAGSDEDGDDDSDDGGSSSNDDDNAASTVAVRGVAPVMAVVMGVLVGAGLVMPW